MIGQDLPAVGGGATPGHLRITYCYIKNKDERKREQNKEGMDHCPILKVKELVNFSNFYRTSKGRCYIKHRKSSRMYSKY